MEPVDESARAGSAQPVVPSPDPVDPPALVPQPVRVLRHTDRLGFVLGPGVRVVVSHSPEALATAVLLAARIGEVCDALVAVQHEDSASPGAIVLRLVDQDALGLPDDLPDELATEAYRLEVRPHGVLLMAWRPAGLLRGAATLLQLGRAPAVQEPDAVPLVVVPAISVVDHPRYAWRGLALRLGASPERLDTLLRTVERMAELKLNVLQVQLDADPDEEELAAYEAVVQHAAARYLTVVPEIGGGDPVHALENVLPRTLGPWVHVGGDAPTSGDDAARLLGTAQHAGKMPVWGAGYLPALVGAGDGADAVPGTVLQARDPEVPSRLGLVQAAVARGARVVACSGILHLLMDGPGRDGTASQRVRGLHATRPAQALGIPEESLLGVGSSLELDDDGSARTCTSDDLGDADDVAAHLAVLAELTWSGPGRTAWDDLVHRLGRLSGRIGRAPALTVEW